MSNRITAAIRAEITRLIDKNDGRLTTDYLVDYARANPESPLYACFTWDDTAAAVQWRLEQAKNLMRTYKVRYELGEDKAVTIRGLVSLPSDRGPEHLYRSVVRVLSNEDQTAEMIGQAKRELHAFRTKYEALERLGKMPGVFAAIGDALDS